MIVGVPQETFAGEKRVALVPNLVPTLIKASMEVRIQSGAGLSAGFPDKLYTDKGGQGRSQPGRSLCGGRALSGPHGRRQPERFPG